MLRMIPVCYHTFGHATARPRPQVPHTHGTMIEVKLEEGDRLEWALKAFKRKMLRSGILKDLRKKRFYVKPSEARQLKASAARRRKRTEKQGR